MQDVSRRHRSKWTVILVIALLWGGSTQAASIHAIREVQKFDTALGYKDILPLKQYQQHFIPGHLPILPCLTSTVLPRCYSPQQLRRAYHIPSLLTGKGRTITFIEGYVSPTVQTDLHYYDQLFGLKDPTLTIFTPYGVPAFDEKADIETMLDVELAHAIAPDATLAIVLGDTSKAQSGQDFLSILLQATKYAVDHNLGDAISQSFGIGETCLNSTYLQMEHQIFREATNKHITLLASAGDNGVLTDVCTGSQPGPGKGVSLPSSDPFVLAVGGTTLNIDTTTGQYKHETAWNEESTHRGATGGGFSSIFPAPWYQRILSSSTTRGVPDVAFDADPLTGVPVVVSLNGQPTIIPVGGTSMGAPAWGAIVALADQYVGRRLGFLNAALYRINTSTSYSKSFHDIITGNNSAYIPNQNPPVLIPGYDAEPGWDAVTGIGTPKVGNLLPLLARYTWLDDSKNL